VDAEVEGFAQFVEARERALQRTAWLLTGDWAMAEDLVQAALARSWPRWEQIRRHDDPEVYVRRVMVNTWASWGRRRWRGEAQVAQMLNCPVGTVKSAVTAVDVVAMEVSPGFGLRPGRLGPPWPQRRCFTSPVSRPG
jgi:DNA-directed RNA polymerase specialized sigma24 family protein